MKEYSKPLVDVVPETAEGVYAASGASGRAKCDSRYMGGSWQAGDYSTWAPGEQRGYKQQYGCNGCPANTGNGCGLDTHYPESGYAGSYDDDAGKRMPSWEWEGHGPNDPVQF